MATRKNVAAIYPLSPMQEGMLFHTLYAPASAVYFEQMDFTLRGNLNIPAFKTAWQQLIDRHPILRTLFMWDRRDKPLQVVRQQVDLPWQQHNWQGLSPDSQQQRLETFLQADRQRDFQLNKAPLMRLALIQLAEQHYQFVWSFHHLLLDGWSTPLLLRELFSRYDALRRGQVPAVSPSPAYQRYIEWLHRQDLNAAKIFWQQALQGFSHPTPLQVDRLTGTAAPPTGAFAEAQLRLSAETTAALHRLARQQQVTLNTLVQAAWALLLSRYSGQTDIVFGATVSGRPADLPGVEQMIGLFINTLPVRVSLSPQTRLGDWLRQLQTGQAQARRYDYSPLVQVQRWSDILPGQPLFETILVFENYPARHASWQQSTNLTIDNLRFFEKTNYPLTISIGPDERLQIHISYNPGRFDAPTIRRLLDHLQTILRGMVTQPEARLFEIPLLTGAERQQIVAGWNQTTVEYPTTPCIHHLFEAQAAQTPEAVALVFPAAGNPGQAEQLSYRQLNERANQLAHYLQSLGVAAETPVALCLPRSPALLVALLATLKAGGAYIPLDPNQPTDRLAYILEETQAPVVLTQQPASTALPPTPAQIVRLDADKARISSFSRENPARRVSPQNLVYIIYTSGSTGQPKGVMLTHASLVNAYRGWELAYGLRPAATAHLQMANVTFDVFSGDWVRALCSGGKLALCPREFLLTPPNLYAYMRQQKITHAEFVPAVMRGLLDYLHESGQSLDFMRLLIVASDSWYVGEYRQILELCGPDTRLLNSYGLTEACIDSSYFEGRLSGQPNDRPVPIGRPFANSRLYILDDQLQPVPVGVPGGLYIAGAGLARGYLNRPAATAERFIPNPFATGGAERLYHTGDLARYLPDGNIEFLGRTDYQVKVRGFRIEPGEIEATLNQHPAVRETAVTLYRPENRPEHIAADSQQLVAYVQPATAADSPKLGATLRQFLQSKLPDYMIPSAFVLLPALPLLPSGKVDRRRLPAPQPAQLGAGRPHTPPRTPTEATLAQIWADVLGLPRVSIDDNFFEVGGHSLAALQLMAQIRKQMQVNLELRWLFDAPTVAGLARLIEQHLPPNNL